MNGQSRLAGLGDSTHCSYATTQGKLSLYLAANLAPWMAWSVWSFRRPLICWVPLAAARLRLGLVALRRHIPTGALYESCRTGIHQMVVCPATSATSVLLSERSVLILRNAVVESERELAATLGLMTPRCPCYNLSARIVSLDGGAETQPTIPKRKHLGRGPELSCLDWRGEANPQVSGRRL
jgi:hypothetical protein